MSNNEIVATLKGKNQSDPWLVIHGDTPLVVEQALDYVGANLIAKLYAVNEQFQAGAATAHLVPAPAQAYVAPPVEQAPQQQEAPPVQQAPPTQVTNLPAPAGVVIWTGPNPTKPQYQATFFQVPFIADPATREAFNAELKNGAWAKPHDTNTKPWTFIAPKGGTEQLVRDTIARYAQQGAFSG